MDLVDLCLTGHFYLGGGFKYVFFFTATCGDDPIR